METKTTEWYASFKTVLPPWVSKWPQTERRQKASWDRIAAKHQSSWDTLFAAKRWRCSGRVCTWPALKSMKPWRLCQSEIRQCRALFLRWWEGRQLANRSLPEKWMFENLTIFQKELRKTAWKKWGVLLISDDKFDCCGLQKIYKKILQMIILDLVNWLDQI